jgi:hypothetical protein
MFGGHPGGDIERLLAAKLAAMRWNETGLSSTSKWKEFGIFRHFRIA